jgi:hypothetical protein
MSKSPKDKSDSDVVVKEPRPQMVGKKKKKKKVGNKR